MSGGKVALIRDALAKNGDHSVRPESSQEPIVLRSLTDIAADARKLLEQTPPSKLVETPRERTERLQEFAHASLTHLREHLVVTDSIETMSSLELARLANEAKVYMLISATTHTSLENLCSESLPIAPLQEQLLALCDTAQRISNLEQGHLLLHELHQYPHAHGRVARHQIVKMFAGAPDDLSALVGLLNHTSLGEVSLDKSIEMRVVDMLSVLRDTPLDEFSIEMRAPAPEQVTHPDIAHERMRTLDNLVATREGEYLGVNSDTELRIAFLTVTAHNADELIAWVQQTHNPTTVALSPNLENGLRELKEAVDVGEDDVLHTYKDIAYVVDAQRLLRGWSEQDAIFMVNEITKYVFHMQSSAIQETISTPEAKDSFIHLAAAIAREFWKPELATTHWLDDIYEQISEAGTKSKEAVPNRVRLESLRKAKSEDTDDSFLATLFFTYLGYHENWPEHHKRAMTSSTYTALLEHCDYTTELTTRAQYADGIIRYGQIDEAEEYSSPLTALRIVVLEACHAPLHPYAVTQVETEDAALYINHIIKAWMTSPEGGQFFKQYPPQFVAPKSEIGKHLAHLIHNIQCERTQTSVQVYADSFANIDELIKQVKTGAAPFPVIPHTLQYLEELRMYTRGSPAREPLYPNTILDVIPLDLESLSPVAAYNAAKAILPVEIDEWSRFAQGTIRRRFLEFAKHPAAKPTQTKQPNTQASPLPLLPRSTATSRLEDLLGTNNSSFMNAHTRVGQTTYRAATNAPKTPEQIADDFAEQLRFSDDEMTRLIGRVVQSARLQNIGKIPIDLTLLNGYGALLELGYRENKLVHHAPFMFENPQHMAMVQELLSTPYEGVESWSYQKVLATAKKIYQGSEAEQTAAAKLVFRRMLFYQVHAIESHDEIHKHPELVAYNAAKYFLLGDQHITRDIDIKLWRDKGSSDYQRCFTNSQNAARLNEARAIRGYLAEHTRVVPVNVDSAIKAVREIAPYQRSIALAQQVYGLLPELTKQQLVTIPPELEHEVADVFGRIFGGFNAQTTIALATLLMSSSVTTDILEQQGRIQQAGAENLQRHNAISALNTTWDSIISLTDTNIRYRADYQPGEVLITEKVKAPIQNDRNILTIAQQVLSATDIDIDEEGWTEDGHFVQPLLDFSNTAVVINQARDAAIHARDISDAIKRKDRTRLKDAPHLSASESTPIIRMWIDIVGKLEQSRIERISYEDPIGSLSQLVFEDELAQVQVATTDFFSHIQDHPLFMSRQQFEVRFGAETATELMATIQMCSNIVPVEKSRDLPMISILCNRPEMTTEALSTNLIGTLQEMLGQLQQRIEISQHEMQEIIAAASIKVPQVEQNVEDDDLDEADNVKPTHHLKSKERREKDRKRPEGRIRKKKSRAMIDEDSMW